jgi:hypothetical protein
MDGSNTGQLDTDWIVCHRADTPQPPLEKARTRLGDSHPDADLACAVIQMAVSARGGKDAIWRADDAQWVIFHTARGSTYTANE